MSDEIERDPPERTDPEVTLTLTVRQLGTLIGAGIDLCSFYQLGTMAEIAALRAIVAEAEALGEPISVLDNRRESLMAEAAGLTVGMLLKRREHEERVRERERENAEQRNEARASARRARLYPKGDKRRRP